MFGDYQYGAGLALGVLGVRWKVGSMICAFHGLGSRVTGLQGFEHLVLSG